jgi:Glycosyl hydrolase catalytic core
MIWGSAIPADLTFLANASTVFLFNEPDMFGPGCCGDWNPPAYGCAPGEWRPASSSGFAPLFSPDAGEPGNPYAAQWAQWAINNMTQSGLGSADTQLISPSMAMDAFQQWNCIGVDPSQPGAVKTCPGWLQMFKTAMLQLTCTDFDGSVNNCWDVLDGIQIHAYAKYASDVIAKVQDYATVFADDFAGANGRSKKSLWITEVACGSNNATEITAFIDGLFDPSTGFNNRTQFSYLSHISWFSSYAFGSFNVSGVAPLPYETWSSTLFYPYGGLTPVGSAFVQACTNGGA